MAHPQTPHLFLELLLFEGAAVAWGVWQLWQVWPRRDDKAGGDPSGVRDESEPSDDG